MSLADILSLRDSCLCEEEVWAVCVECVSALQSIGPSSLFHTLCITPDTLAFNAHGNVCFMEQLSGKSTHLDVNSAPSVTSVVFKHNSLILLWIFPVRDNAVQICCDV